MRKFPQTQNILLILLAFTSITSCNPYRKIGIDGKQLYEQKRFVEYYDRYVYIVHDQDQTYALDSVSIDRNNALSGQAKLLEVDSVPKKVPRKVRRKTIHLFVSDAYDLEINEDAKVVIPQKEIKRAELYAKKRQGFFGVLWSIVIGILAFFGVLIIIAIIGIATSDGSNSNSDPNCYVATMVYGSTDANELDVLRSFRDRILSRLWLGRKFISWYYANSPGFVEKHQEKKWLHAAIKPFLDALVKAISIVLKG